MKEMGKREEQNWKIKLYRQNEGIGTADKGKWKENIREYQDIGEEGNRQKINEKELKGQKMIEN